MKALYKLPAKTNCEDEQWVEATIRTVITQLETIRGRNAGLGGTWKKRISPILIGVGKQLIAVGQAIKEHS
ncbi:unnamed protein product [marine sediment metagenome]|uniref:Uncharacterized protein n=1 Tax=marine sediment metagenome TaxID=412755 RepID=X1ISK2_9ZZZZ